MAYAPNSINQYTTVGSASLTYDGNGNLTGDGVASYGYDPLGRRRSESVGGTTPEYLYNAARVIAGYDAADNRLRRFVYGLGLDEPLALINAGFIQQGAARELLHQAPRMFWSTLSNWSRSVADSCPMMLTI